MSTPLTDNPFNQQMQGGSNGRYWFASAPVYGGPGSLTNYGAGAVVAYDRTESRASYTARHNAIDYTGVMLGETIAWRAWRIMSGYLTSVFLDVAWLPEEPMHGDVVRHGVHAFKRKTDAFNAYIFHHDCDIALGQVALWGEVVEHERGFRAEYGRVHSLDAVWLAGEVGHVANDLVLGDLREKYCP